MTIPVDKIREVIGPGGKIINKIIDETGVAIDIEDDGRVFIASTDSDAGQKAKRIIESLVKEVEVGEHYTGTVTRIMNFGAFVEILPGKEGLDPHFPAGALSRGPSRRRGQHRRRGAGRGDGD